MQTKKGFVTPLIIVLVALALIGGGIYWYSSSDDESSTTETMDENSNQTNTQGQTTTNSSNTTNGDTQTVSGWKIHSNVKYGYSIKYPSNWVMGDLAAPTAIASDEVFAIHTASGDMSFRLEVTKNEPQGLDNAHTQTTVTVAGLTRKAYLYPTGKNERCPGGAFEDCSMFIVPVYNGGNWYVMTADGGARNVAGVYADIITSLTFGPSVTTKFENKTYGFSFDYPSNWKVTDLSATALGKKTGMVKIASPVRKDIAGYEQSGVQYVLQLSFADGKVTLVDQGFIRADTAASQTPTKVTLSPSALSVTSEYKVGQDIIASAKAD